MNVDQLLRGFDFLGDAPETIQRFRKLVVGLAISGRLDPSAPTGKESAVLAETVGGQKVQLKKADRKNSAPSKVVLDDLPTGFSKPELFVRLGDIARIEKGLTGIMKAFPGPFPLVVTGADRVPCDHYDFDGVAAIVPLVSSTGHGKASLQRLHYQEGKFALGSILAAIFPYEPDLVSARFIFEYLTAFKDELLVARMIGTANVSLSVGKVAEVPIPLVSPAAQRTVDELMALCDRIATARVERESRRDRLAASSLARINSPDPDSFQDDARFALDVLPALTTRPDQVKQLRQTILNLAVRGKLVAQDPKEEPVSEALKTISKRKIEAALRKTKSVAPVEKSEKWMELPIGWEWVRWDHLTDWITYGFTRPMPHEETGPRIITGKNVNFGRIIFETADRTSEDAFNDLSEKDKPIPGDILITKDGSVGRTAIVNSGEAFCINQSVAVLWLRSCHFSRPFLKMVLDSPTTQAALLEKTAGVAIKHISIIDLGKMSFAIPPVAEQHRIVAKVDELMGLCDRLEASLSAGEEHRSSLLTAILGEALSPAEV